MRVGPISLPGRRTDQAEEEVHVQDRVAQRGFRGPASKVVAA